MTDENLANVTVIARKTVLSSKDFAYLPWHRITKRGRSSVYLATDVNNCRMQVLIIISVQVKSRPFPL